MHKQLITWQLIEKSLKHKVPVMLLYVLESSGSSPGRQGFFMAVNTDDEMEGSIGGGIMEHKFVEMAKEHLKKNAEEHEIRKQYHDKKAAKDQSGMICSGEQTIYLYHVQPKDLHAIEHIISALTNNRNGLFTLSSEGIFFFKEAEPFFNYHYHFVNKKNWQYQERLGYKNNLHIIGGGHCALAFSKLMCDMDFYIYLYDNREALHTMEQNEFVHQKIVVNNYAELSKLIESDKKNYVVIMTFGYRSDEEALRSLLGKDFSYLGLLGSKTKIKKMFDEFKKEGISEKTLKSVHAPIGIPIKSKTPEEIAVSIAAQIIKEKNKTQ